MTTTAYAKPAAVVIPLQRNEARSDRRRDTVDRTLPPATDTAWYDAETEAMLAGEHNIRHGRRCACGCHPVTTHAEVAS